MSRYVVTCTWDDVPHLSQEVKDELWASIPVYQREARSKGIPALGSGAIYPISEDDVAVQEFEIPAHWPRGYAMDTGWSWTAAVFAALDRENDTLYIYDVYKRGQAEAAVHAEAIRARGGSWMRGVADAAAINNADGRQWIDIYRGLGLDLNLPDKSVEAGIQDTWGRISTGRLKVFKRLSPWFEEFRLYRRDENGKIVKENDHVMDTTRYMVRSGIQRMRVSPKVAKPLKVVSMGGGRPMGWMA